MNCSKIFFFGILTLSLGDCKGKPQQEDKTIMSDEIADNLTPAQLDTATFGAGCFWCVEAVFQELKGVQSVKPGYAGGHIKNPSYKEVCTGTTGHAEVAQIIYDPSVISYEILLDVFWHTHDPTTLNRQGADVGTQYRSVIFYHNEAQHEAAKKSKLEANSSGLWDGVIVTEITPLDKFYEAEDYHNNYFSNNPNQPYCNAVIAPKVKKFRQKYEYLLK